MASTKTSASAGVLACTVAIEPVTHANGQIVLTVTPVEDQKNPLCDTLILSVPIGPKGADFFSKPPAININQPAWAPSSYISRTGASPNGLLAKATSPDGAVDDATDYQHFVIKNQDSGQGLASTKFPLEITLTGSLNAVKGEPVLLVQETYRTPADNVPKLREQKQIPLEKASRSLLYIESFYASKVPVADDAKDKAKEKATAPTTKDAKTEAAASATGNTSDENERDPITKFRSGEPFMLSWESNGSNYMLFQDEKPITDGIAKFHVIEGGITTDTTFVLQAKDTNTATKLYASLTVTVSNPAFIAEPITLQQVLKQTDDDALKTILEWDGGDVKRALLMAEGSNIGRMLQRTQDPKLQELLFEYLFRSGNSLKKVLEKTNGITLKNALKESTDANLRDAIEQAPDALLRNALQPTDLAKARLAIKNNEIVTLKRLVGQSNDPKIKTALKLAETPTPSLQLEQSDDTDHCLRVGDGTLNGNMVFQAQTGDNSGLTTVNFNGYSSGGEKRFNPAKSRYQLGADQRGDEDLFFIKVYKSETPLTAFTINPQAQVGINTLLLGSNGYVNDNTKPSDPQGKKLAFSTSEVDDSGYQFYGLGNSGKQLNFFAGGDDYSAPKMVLNSSGNVGIGTTTPPLSPLSISPGACVAKITLWDGGNPDRHYGFGISPSQLNYEVMGEGSRHVFYAGGKNGSGSELMRIQGDGRVGIGTTTPVAKLHVKGGALASVQGNIGITYFDPGGGFAQTGSHGDEGGNIAAYFEDGALWVRGRIGAGTITANSDRRIKHIVGLSDCAADLDLLKKIRVTDYTYIDKLVYTDQVMKKLIAQEIQELLPSAVSTSTQAVPDVYEKAVRVSYADGRVTVTSAKAHELPASGGKMRLYTPANEDVSADATVVDAHTFSFASTEAHEAGLFVYGKVVDDFLSIDYDAVAMLNVSATQALARQVDDLHLQNAALHEQNRTQGARLDEMQAALHALQQQMATLLGQPNILERA